MQLAESLSRLREAGRAHGAVTPANLALVAGGVELLPASQGSPAAITPYTAPEVVGGGAADARSDIFSFGAILFEMLTGRQGLQWPDPRHCRRRETRHWIAWWVPAWIRTRTRATLAYRRS